MRTWVFLINPFLTAARKSYPKALKISIYHDAQLKANLSDPFFASMYSIYHPLHLTLSGAYSIWRAEGGTRKGSTLNVAQLLKLLSPTKMNAWEYAIIGTFAKGSPEYVTLFPKNRGPFNSGSKEIRIAAVSQLANALGQFPSLATTKADVDDFYQQLTTNRQVQLGNIGTVENKSAEVESAIETAMIEMYSDFGLLASHFKNNPALAEPFFDLVLLRNHSQIVYKKTVKAGKVRHIIQHTFGIGDSITISNDGTAALQFYLAASKTATVSTPFLIDANSQQTIAVSELGDIGNRFLNVYNAEINSGHCKVELG